MKGSKKMSRNLSNLFHNINGTNISDLDFDEMQDEFDDFYTSEKNNINNDFKFDQESNDY